jgi:hypothetical protein
MNPGGPNVIPLPMPPRGVPIPLCTLQVLYKHEQQDLIATPWQIWERIEVNEYIEPDYHEDSDEQEGVEEREEEQVWIDKGVIAKEQERQAARHGKGTL